jgi:predicted metal-dependent HD superfamily phosphohydrolase
MNAHNDDLAVDLAVDLRAVWQRYISESTEQLEGLLARYRERHRRYHTTTHVAWVIRHAEDLSVDESITDLDAVVAAAFYHDAVYEPRYPANERASARLARRDLNQLAWTENRIDGVVAMIEATQGHLHPPDTDTGVLFDADLAILGAGPEDYKAYVKAVRSEYRHLDDEEWSVGRGRVLQGFIERGTIFATRSGRSRWEQAARANLATELESVS